LLKHKGGIRETFLQLIAAEKFLVTEVVGIPILLEKNRNVGLQTKREVAATSESKRDVKSPGLGVYTVTRS
jgi:hypothetical protein